MRFIVLMIFTAFSSKAYAIEECDTLGSLEADPLAISEPVKFHDIQGAKLIEFCTMAISKQNEGLPRYHLLRARGYLSSGSFEEAESDITHSHDMGYAAATAALHGLLSEGSNYGRLRTQLKTSLKLVKAAEERLLQS